MKKFLDFGEKQFPVYLCGVDIGQFAIVMHSAEGPKAPPALPAWTEKAGRVLRQYLYRISGVELPVYYDTYPLKREHEILIGGTVRACDETAGYAYADDEYVLFTKEGNLIINGGKRGVLYGVYTFLEKYCGVRYFTDTVEKIADAETIEIAEICEHAKPVFEYREICDWTAWDPDFSVKMKVNGTFVRKLRAEDGYGMGYAGGNAGLVHTFHSLVPPDQWYHDHPEFYALNEQGVRNPSGLCFSNDEAFAVLLENAKKWLKEEEDPTMLSVSINDGNAFCKCEKCRKIYEQGGNDTDALLRLVNRFAREIKKEYPHLLIDTISYGETEEPPEFERPESNVIARVCTWCAGNYSIPQALASDAKEAPMERTRVAAQRVQELSGIFSKVYVWDYPYCYHVINCHYPVLGVVRENYRFFAEHGVKGVFINGETDTSDFVGLKVYLLSKLLYDPYMSQEEFDGHAEDFLYGYYGKGGKCIGEYLRYTQSIAEGGKAYASLTSNAEIFGLKLYDDGTYDDFFIKKSRSFFEKAAQCAETDAERARIRKASLVVDSFELYYCMDHVMRKGSEEKKEEFVARNRKYYEDIIAAGIPRIIENTFFPVVKNFRQSPREWEYWDPQCLAGDRNNENYARETYLLLPVGEELGTIVDGGFLCKTNNENEEGYLSVWTENGFVTTPYNPTWEGTYENWQHVVFRGACVTNVYEFSRRSGIALNDLRINLIPRHHKGILVKVDQLDAGAYIFFRKSERKP